MNAIQKRISESISDSDFERYLGKDVKDKIFLYADLENYSFNQLLPKARDYAIILIEEKINRGHWVCLTKDSHDKMVTFFDSYGVRPTGQLKWVSAKTNRSLDNENHDIENILNEAYAQGYKIFYNKKRFQKGGNHINTCGRHVICFIKCFFNYSNIYDYIQFMEQMQHELNMDSDHIVAKFIE